MLKDVQAEPDARGVPLNDVGIDELRYPVLVADGQGGKREVVATITMSVSLAPDVKGAHLSRFIDVLHEWRDQLGPDSALRLVDDLRQRMGSETARATLAFPYFLERHAPVSGHASFMDYACTLTVTATDTAPFVSQRVKVPVTSVCPCSKAISDRGAHNQRGWVTIDAQPNDPRGELWFDDLIEVAEAAGSSPVYALLKRPDERHVTMAGYDNPKFVEDIARDIARTLDTDPRIARYAVKVVNDESIHNHAAYAQVPWTTVGGLGNAGRGAS
ncbi:GTP cyclohydrolase FolE2 [Saccharomonospora piscinae]|uniref:GTP cyclohydrolase FolE2 n=1 Tax=Saccharomonospora piscinae TaxID=687388 RepID=UPI000464C54D|nr:GTP cyclohydrolase FolE2 [Saccharomonospora piscinae]